MFPSSNGNPVPSVGTNWGPWEEHFDETQAVSRGVSPTLLDPLAQPQLQDIHTMLPPDRMEEAGPQSILYPNEQKRMHTILKIGACPP